MSLQTYEEQEILRKVRELDRKIDLLFILTEEILRDLRPKFEPTTAIVVTPTRFEK